MTAGFGRDITAEAARATRTTAKATARTLSAPERRPPGSMGPDGQAALV